MASPQYSSVQILEAARRAEAEGKLDYAVQFYRHIVEHHGATPEAYEARDSFLRLTQQRRADELRNRWAGSGAPPGYHGGGPPPVSGAVSPQSARYGDPTINDARVRRPEGPANLPQVLARNASPPAHGHAEPEFDFKERYRAGTIMAQGANWLGWLLVGVGAAFGVAGLAAMPKAMAVASVFGLPAGVIYGLAAAAGGLALVFASQLALAVFDNANASRQLLAIERAKAEL